MTRATSVAAHELLAMFRNLWPEVFVREGPRYPLDRRISRQIAAEMPALDPALLARALAIYTSDPIYLRSITPGAPRFGLSGRIDGEVDAAEAERAARRLAEIEARKRERLEIADLRGAITRAGQALRRGDPATAARELRPFEPKRQATP